MFGFGQNEPGAGRVVEIVLRAFSKGVLYIINAPRAWRRESFCLALFRVLGEKFTDFVFSLLAASIENNDTKPIVG